MEITFYDCNIDNIKRVYIDYYRKIIDDKNCSICTNVLVKVKYSQPFVKGRITEYIKTDYKIMSTQIVLMWYNNQFYFKFTNVKVENIFAFARVDNIQWDGSDKALKDVSDLVFFKAKVFDTIHKTYLEKKYYNYSFLNIQTEDYFHCNENLKYGLANYIQDEWGKNVIYIHWSMNENECLFTCALTNGVKGTDIDANLNLSYIDLLKQHIESEISDGWGECDFYLICCDELFNVVVENGIRQVYSDMISDNIFF